MLSYHSIHIFIFDLVYFNLDVITYTCVFRWFTGYNWKVLTLALIIISGGEYLPGRSHGCVDDRHWTEGETVP